MIQSTITLARRNTAATFSYTTTFLIVSTIFIWFCAFKLPQYNLFGQDSLVANVRVYIFILYRALLIIMLMFVALAIIYLPDGIIIRPSQVLWKGVTGFSMFYLLVLTFFVLLSPEQTQLVLSKIFDSSLGKPL
jgi:hypothetical protein